jgi:hypothetical protein
MLHEAIGLGAFEGLYLAQHRAGHCAMSEKVVWPIRALDR